MPEYAGVFADLHASSSMAEQMAPLFDAARKTARDALIRRAIDTGLDCLDDGDLAGALSVIRVAGRKLDRFDAGEPLRGSVAA